MPCWLVPRRGCTTDHDHCHLQRGVVRSPLPRTSVSPSRAVATPSFGLVTMSNAVSTQALNYLQRVGVTAGRGESLESLTAGDPGRRRLLRVLGIGRLGKAEDGRPTEREERIPSEQLLTGLGQHRIPLAFLVESAGTEASVQLGTWWPTGDHGYSPDRLDANERVLRSLARGIYLTSDDELASARPEQPGA